MPKKTEVDSLMKIHGIKRTMANNMLRTRKSVKKGSLTDSEGKPLKLKRKSVAKTPAMRSLVEYRQHRKIVLAKRITKTAPETVHTKVIVTATNKKKK